MNLSYQHRCRSPIFKDGSFVYVSFPHPDEHGARPYPRDARPFIRNLNPNHTHFDPDWPNLTYGDNIGNARASALKRVLPGDTLLFWAMLWQNRGRRWEDFTGERSWYFIGALRVEEILYAGQSANDATRSNRKRAGQNVHCCNCALGRDTRVFIGDRQYSQRFCRAVDLQTTRSNGLLFRTIKTASGNRLSLGGAIPWNSSTRSCRVIWDLAASEQRRRAKIASDAIYRESGYDLLHGASTEAQ